MRPDVVLVAAGYRTGLAGLFGHLGVLDTADRPRFTGARPTPGAPGLRITGFTNPISGMFRELRIDATRLAKRLA